MITPVQKEHALQVLKGLRRQCDLPEGHHLHELAKGCESM